MQESLEVIFTQSRSYQVIELKLVWGLHFFKIVHFILKDFLSSCKV